MLKRTTIFKCLNWCGRDTYKYLPSTLVDCDGIGVKTSDTCQYNQVATPFTAVLNTGQIPRRHIALVHLAE